MTTNNKTTNARNLLAQTKFYESYSRYDSSLGRYETWDEAVDRVMEMHRTKYADRMTQELEEIIKRISIGYKKKLFVGAQRALQFGGEQILKHESRLYNCTSSYADRPAFFGEYLYFLLSGSGVGASVQFHHVYKLPKIAARTKQPKTFVIEDSIEGWANAFEVLVSSYFVNGGRWPDYTGRKVYFDLTKIRPKGSPISGGYLAPGPDPLRRTLDRIEHLLTGLVIQEKDQIQLEPIHVYDICMHGADAVLSGGIRRAATIFLFSPEDQRMMNAKTGDWFTTNPQRARSNNSAVLVRGEVKRELFNSLIEANKQFGEPGFIFTDNRDFTYNPCVEIGMFPVYNGESGFQGCNLTEINGGAIQTLEDFKEAVWGAAALGTLQAGYTNFKYLTETTKNIFERESLLGVSITGILNNISFFTNENNLKEGVKIIKATNEYIASLININPAARLTCVKPAGSTSVLLETSSGIHPEHSKQYIRHMQANKDTPTAKLLFKTNPNMVEESVWSSNKSDYVLAFPVISSGNSLYKNELTDIEFLEIIKKIQKYWVLEGTVPERCTAKGLTHNVSNTVTVDDWDKVEDYIFNNMEYFAAVSFLPRSGDKAYNQAPFTEVLNFNEISEKYGTGALFASGLITESMNAFDNLWNACATANGYGENVSEENHSNTMKKDWIRRYKKYADNYFNSDYSLTEMCLKDVYLLHKWEKIQRSIKPVDWSQLNEEILANIDEQGAMNCNGSVEGCLI